MDVGKLISAILIFFLGLIEVLLGLRFVFMLLAANSGAEFTATIYATTESLVSPFAGVFPSFEVGAFTLEVSTALAMIIYGLIGVLLLQLAHYFEGLRVKASHPASVPPYAQPIQTSQPPIMQVQQPQMPPANMPANPQNLPQTPAMPQAPVEQTPPSQTN